MLLLGLEKNLTFGIFIIENITCCLLKKNHNILCLATGIRFWLLETKEQAFSLVGILGTAQKSTHMHARQSAAC